MDSNCLNSSRPTSRSLSTDNSSPSPRPPMDKRSLSLSLASPSPRKPGPRKPRSCSSHQHSTDHSLQSDSTKSLPPSLHRNPPIVQLQPRHSLNELEQKIKARTGTILLRGRTYPAKLDDMDQVVRIGHGICGEVYRMRHKPTGVKLASKKMLWQNDSREEHRRVLMDLEVMTSQHSPYIVEYFGSAIITNEVWVFMELMSTCLDRLLKRIAGPIPELIVCKMCVSIVKALHYLKQHHQVIHRDVKPSNILLDTEGNVKLCDFGISGRLVESKAFTRGAGCAAYMAPERISIAHAPEGYDVRADVWSLGISLVELAMGSSPYSRQQFNSEFELLTHIVNADPPLLDKDEFSAEFYDFVAKCLCKDVESRPQYSQLLQHPLILQFDKKPVDIAAWYSEMCQTHGPP